MSLLFISVNDFIGEINLDLSNDTNVINQFESLGRQVEDDLLLDLLNAKLLADLIADLDPIGNPQTQTYIDLVDGKTYVDQCGETIKYEGLKRLLKYFVYEQTLDFTHSQNATNGQEYSANENSIKTTRSQLRKIRAKIQNKGVDLYHSAIDYINDNYETLFTGNDYSFWMPVKKKYLGKITTVTPRNEHYYNTGIING